MSRSSERRKILRERQAKLMLERVGPLVVGKKYLIWSAVSGKEAGNVRVRIFQGEENVERVNGEIEHLWLFNDENGKGFFYVADPRRIRGVVD